jgi:hypothetical protein
MTENTHDYYQILNFKSRNNFRNLIWNPSSEGLNLKFNPLRQPSGDRNHD